MKSETTGRKILSAFFMLIYIMIITLTFSSDTMMPKLASMLIIPIAFLVMLVRVDFDRLGKMYTLPMCLAFSIILIYLHSIVIWIINIEQSIYIVEGSQRVIFQLVNVLVAFSAVYIFGSKAIDYTLYGAIIINTKVFISALLKYGVSSSISSFLDAVKTGEQVGFMNEMEIHQLTYIYGFFIIYYLFISDYSKKRKALMIGLCVVYMTLGFKRIIFASILIAVVLTLAFFVIPEKAKSPFALAVASLTALMSFLFIPMIKSGLFEKVMDDAGVDTMSRIDLYNFMSPTYEFTPKFFGRGSEFVMRYLQVAREQQILYNGKKVGASFIHNDILVRYIELGFFGFIGWLYFMCFFVFKWMKKHYGIVVGAMYAVMNTTNFINFSVGNTNRDYCVRLVIEVILFATIYKIEFEDKKLPEVRSLLGSSKSGLKSKKRKKG